MSIEPRWSEAMTVLTGEAVATKTITRNANGALAILGFSAGTWFSATEVALAGIEPLSALLHVLERTPNSFVIRGAAICDPDAKGLYLRRKSHFQTPAKGRRWILIDFDKVPLPSGLELIENPAVVMEYLVHLLPKEFHEVSYHYQLSSSAGLFNARVVSAHIWFWLAQPRSDQDLKRWAKMVNGTAQRKLVDPALFNDVQPHYTAAPVFLDVADPFPRRCGLVRKELAAVDLQVPKETWIRPAVAGPTGLSGSLGFDLLLAKVGDHDGGDGFHEAIIKAIAAYVFEHGRRGTDREALYEQVRSRVLAADRSKHDQAYVAEMASRRHIMSAIDGAIEKFGDRPESRRRSRLVPDLPAPARAPVLKKEEAYRQLSVALDEIIAL